MNGNDKTICNPTRRNLNVENAANVLDGAVADLHETVQALESHLQPLLGDDRPCEKACDRSRGDSEVAERLLDNADAVRGRSERIRQLIDRL